MHIYTQASCILAAGTLIAALPSPFREEEQRPLNSMECVSVPGNASAVFNGDPSHDLLNITAVDMWWRTYPNVGFEIDVYLHGNFTFDLGPAPMLKLTSYHNGTKIGSNERPLCNEGPGDMVIIQDGRLVCPPHEGAVAMSYSKYGLYDWFRRAFYTIRVEMWATDGTRVTDFNGTV